MSKTHRQLPYSAFDLRRPRTKRQLTDIERTIDILEEAGYSIPQSYKQKPPTAYDDIRAASAYELDYKTKEEQTNADS